MEFQDLLRLRYGISLDKLPIACVCGKPYDITHALNCTTGGFIHKRHNELRDLLANIIRETCFDVSIEPSLQPVVQTNANRAEDGARLDIAARGFWRTGQRTLFDVRIFNPRATTNINRKISETFKHHEQEKIKNYQERILNSEHASFTPIIYSTSGDCSNLTSTFISQLALLTSEKRGTHYSETILWLRTRVNFCIMRGALLCIRGSRKMRSQTCYNQDISINNSLSRRD